MPSRRCHDRAIRCGAGEKAGNESFRPAQREQQERAVIGADARKEILETVLKALRVIESRPGRGAKFLHYALTLSGGPFLGLATTSMSPMGRNSIELQSMLSQQSIWMLE
jgi:hypothetical protein